MESSKMPWGTRIVNSLRARWFGYPLIAAVLVASWATQSLVKARDRSFYERDPTLSYPYKSDTVPDWALAFIGGLGPLFFIVLTQVLIRKSKHSYLFDDTRLKDIHLVIIVLGEVLSFTWLITNVLKIFVGSLRPDFFAYCDYKGYNEAVNSDNYTTYLSLTEPGRMGDFSYCNSDALDAHFSFPSGHSSLSFCGLTFMALFLTRVLSALNFKHHSVGMVLRIFVILIPMFSGALVAASRVIDYKHHVEDTVWGALIGILGAYMAFNGNYGYNRPHYGYSADGGLFSIIVPDTLSAPSSPASSSNAAI